MKIDYSRSMTKHILLLYQSLQSLLTYHYVAIKGETEQNE